jgi:tRNA-modifying protein YgfZ
MNPDRRRAAGTELSELHRGIESTMADAEVFRRIANHAGLFDRSDRRRLAVSGPDRAKFLHNLVTNDVKRLPIGKGCEAFVTSTQGRTLAFLIILAAEDAILIGTDAGGIDALLPHLRKYGVFDDVAIEDVSATTFEYHLAGPAAEEIVRHCAGQLPENVDLAHVQTEVAGHSVRLLRESPAGLAGLTLIGEITAAGSIKSRLLSTGDDSGVSLAGQEVFDVLRIEAGTPVFGKDISEKNLPQEIGRDARAINFVKGCYLGQETVARLDALGHVNQILRGLVFEPGSPCPEPGATLEANGKQVGVVTTIAFSPVVNAPVALAIVRTSHAAQGTRVKVMVADHATSIAAIVSGLPTRSP